MRWETSPSFPISKGFSVQTQAKRKVNSRQHSNPGMQGIGMVFLHVRTITRRGNDDRLPTVEDYRCKNRHEARFEYLGLLVLLLNRLVSFPRT